MFFSFVSLKTSIQAKAQKNNSKTLPKKPSKPFFQIMGSRDFFDVCFFFSHGLLWFVRVLIGLNGLSLLSARGFGPINIPFHMRLLLKGDCFGGSFDC